MRNGEKVILGGAAISVLGGAAAGALGGHGLLSKGSRYREALNLTKRTIIRESRLANLKKCFNYNLC